MSAAASGNFPWSVVPEPPAGRTRFDWLRLDAAAERPTSRCLAARGRFPGPAVLVAAALDQIGSPAHAAALRLAEALDAARLRGSLLVLMPDGAPLSRVIPFPGTPDGDDRRRLAHALALEIIAPADVVIELRGADAAERNDGVAVHYLGGREHSERRAADVARALGLPFSLGTRAPGSPTTIAAQAARLDRTAVLAQLPDDSQTHPSAEELFGGLVNGLRAAGALEGPATTSDCAALMLAGVVIVPVAGQWEPALRIGQRLRVHDELGVLRDTSGGELGRMRATEAGIVVSYRMADAVKTGDALAVIGR